MSKSSEIKRDVQRIGMIEDIKGDYNMGLLMENEYINQVLNQTIIGSMPLPKTVYKEKGLMNIKMVVDRVLEVQDKTVNVIKEILDGSEYPREKMDRLFNCTVKYKLWFKELCRKQSYAEKEVNLVCAYARLNK